MAQDKVNETFDAEPGNMGLGIVIRDDQLIMAKWCCPLGVSSATEMTPEERLKRLACVQVRLFWNQTVSPW